MNKWFRWVVGVILVAVILLYGFTFTVYEGEVAVVTRFGRARTVVTQAGLHWKLPVPFESVYVYDGRLTYFDASFVEVLTGDKKNVILQCYATWLISDPLKFLKSTGDVATAELHLNSLIASAQNSVLGEYLLSALVSTNPEELKLGEIEGKIFGLVAEQARSRYGIEIRQVGMKTLGLPRVNLEHVFEQMRSERQQYISRFRAEGERDASAIRSETDVLVARLRSEGITQAAKILGKAEYEVAKIYGDAFRENPELYSFLRQLVSLERMLDENTTLIFRIDSPPFNIITNPGAVMRP